MYEDKYYRISFQTRQEAAAFVAALSRFLNYPHGNEYLNQVHALAVWVQVQENGEATDLILNSAAVRATEAGFGAIPASTVSQALPASARQIIGGRSLPAWGVDNALAQLSDG